MNCILISGATSVGKSQTIYRLANRLIASPYGFSIVAGNFPATFKDFKIVIEGKNKLGIDVRIIINSPTDTIPIINDFKKFSQNNGTYDILISSVRDNSYLVRQDFFTIMNIATPKDFILEIPLAKITRQSVNNTICMNWYQNQIDNLINHILNLNPFNI